MYPTQNFEIFHLQWVPGLILSKNSDFFQKTFNFGDFLGVKNGEKSEMFDEMGQNSSKFGNFDTDRCARISGPQKCWFWPTFPNFGGPKKLVKNSFFLFWLFSGFTGPPIGPY